MIARKFTSEEISSIIGHLKTMFPDYEIRQSTDPNFIHFSKKMWESRVDTLPVGVYYTEQVHIFECYDMVGEERMIHSILEKTK